MQLVSFPSLAPSVCVVCEGVPPETPFVDTERTFEPNGYTHLNGRKYLCAVCVSEAATVLDISADAVAPVQAALDEQAQIVVQLQADVESYKNISAAIEALSERPVIQVEGSVQDALDAVKSKNAGRSKAAADAQEQLKVDEAAVAAGAARQVELDQAAADKQTADGVKALTDPLPVDPLTGVGAIPLPPETPTPVEPVTEPAK